MTDLTGKSAVITGSTFSFGRGFVQTGAHLVLSGFGGAQETEAPITPATNGITRKAICSWYAMKPLDKAQIPVKAKSHRMTGIALPLEGNWIAT